MGALWIMASLVPLTLTAAGLEGSLAASCEYIRQHCAHPCIVWQMPGGTPAIARYVRVQMEGLGVLRVRQLKVFGHVVLDRDSVKSPSAMQARPSRLDREGMETGDIPLQSPSRLHTSIIICPPRPHTSLGASPARRLLFSSPALTREHDSHGIGQPLCRPGRPKNYTLERGVHHLECVSLQQHGWKDSWPRPGTGSSSSTPPATQAIQKSRRRRGETDMTRAEAETEAVRCHAVLAVRGDKGTTLLERLCFQASALHQVAGFLIREPAHLVNDVSYTGLVKNVSKDRCVVELDRC
jgi:hypothetical protein